MANCYKYKTIQGDTFDAIALDFYGEETLSSAIMLYNPDYINVLVFGAGVELLIPVIDAAAPSTLPPWRQ